MREAANKLLLLHANMEIATLFDEIATYRVANEQQVVPFMLRQMAVRTIRTGIELLENAGRSLEVGSHGWSTRGMTVHAIQVRGSL